VPPLRFSEVRKGVQALSSLYVERRREGGLASRASEGAAKRAALATFYAPLHFLVAYAAAARLAAPRARRVHDLGCGTGAAGAAVALALGAAAGGATPSVHGVDVSGFALAEWRATLRAFGLSGHARRGALPAAFPERAGAEDVLVLGYVANELGADARAALLARLCAARGRGAGLLVLEPLARGIAPWWPDAARALAAHGVESLEIKLSVDRPEWIARLDDAAGLDHREIGARILAAPPANARTVAHTA
jgi:SAM-dependent methyltransferase